MAKASTMVPVGIYEQLTVFGGVEYVVEWPDGHFNVFTDYPTFEQLIR
jgi:hypothetical protein